MTTAGAGGGSAGPGPACRPVFISYPRKTSLDAARELHATLGGDVGLAFLDETDIAVGEQIPDQIIDGLLGSQVFVAFVDDVYFSRWYCLWELRTAMREWDHLVRHGRPDLERAAALHGVVVVLPPAASGVDTTALTRRLPPPLRTISWLTAADTDRLADLVRTRLSAPRPPLGERLAGIGELDAVRETAAVAGLPPPIRLDAGQGVFAAGPLPESLGERFVGRADDLARIDWELNTARGGDPVAESTVCLHGGAGSGKTRLAVEYLRRLGPTQFAGGLFWLNASLAGQRERQLHGVLRTLDPSVPDSLRSFKDAGRDLTSELTAALRKMGPRRALLVLDNVPEPGPHQRPLRLADWCPALGDVALLVTSRLDLSIARSSVQLLRVRPLLSPDAVRLLTRDVDRSQLDNDGWSAIAGWVGRLPLALELLNATLRLGGLSPSELHAMALASKSEPVPMLDHTAEVLREEMDAAPPGITEAFRISYERLTPERRQAARLVACLAPEPVPVALMQALGEQAIPVSARMALVARSFVTPVESGEVEIYGLMHRLLAAYLRGHPSGIEAELEQVGRTLLPLLDPTLEPSHWPLMDLCQPHAEHVSRLLEDAISLEGKELCVVLRASAGIHAAARGDFEGGQAHQEAALELSRRLLGDRHWQTMYVANQLGWLLRERGDLPRAQKLLQEVLATREARLGPGHMETARAANDLGVVLQDQGRFEEAEALLRRALDIRRGALGQDDPLTAQSLSNVGIVRKDRGDLEEARELMETALDVRERILGADHSDTVSSLNDVGSLLWQMGRLDEARALLERSLGATEQLYGKEHLETATPLNNLGGLLFDLHDFRGARACHERCLAIRERVLGPEHSETARSLSNLGATLRALHEMGAARSLLERGLAISLQVLGEEHPDTAWVQTELSTLLAECGELDRARELGEQALAARTRVLGVTHPDAVSSVNHMGLLLHLAGDTEGALTYFELALQSRLEVLGAEHHLAAQSHHNLGVALYKCHRYEEAKRQLERALELRRALLGGDHLVTALSYQDLANVHVRLHEFEDAVRCNERCLEILRREPGADPFRMATVLHNLGVSQHESGRLAEARASLEEALASRERLLGPDSYDVAATMKCLGRLLVDMGDPLAQTLLEGSLDIRTRLLGASHPETLDSSLGLSVLHFSQGNLVAAEDCLRKALRAAEGAQPPDEPTIAQCHHNLGATRYRMGDVQEAVDHLRQAMAIRARVLGDRHPETELSRRELRFVEDTVQPT